MNASSASGWVVYSRADCSLCEALCTELTALLGARADIVRVVDIAGDPELERRYGHRIPVLTVDDEFVCAYRLDLARVKPYLSGRALPI